MNNQALNSYLSKLNRFNRSNTLYGIAPFKPILLTSIIELIKKGFTQNKLIYVNTDLLGTFQLNWLLLVNTLNQPDFIQSIYYLQLRFYPKQVGRPSWVRKSIEYIWVIYAICIVMPSYISKIGGNSRW